MQTKVSECIYTILNRHGLLDRVMGTANDSRRAFYANRLILDSNRLSFEPRQPEDYVSLQSIAERKFAVSDSWVHAFADGMPEIAADWERARAKELGRCFTWYFADIEEGLPLHVSEGGEFRRATASNEAFRLLQSAIEGDWTDLAIYEGPPDWSKSLFIRLRELDLHQKFFGAYWDWRDRERAKAARSLRQEAFEFALARFQPSAQDEKILGKWLIPVIELWPQVRDILGLRGIQAVAFTEEMLARFNVTIYSEDEDSGLWIACASKRATSYVADLGHSNYAHAFFNGEACPIDGWDDVRIAAKDFQTILAEARKISAGPEGSLRVEQVASSDKTPPYMSSNHPNYSSKLAAAVAAWLAVTEEPSLVSGKTVKGAITGWLTKNASKLGLAKNDGTLNRQGIDEVAKVANWKVEGGAPGTPRRGE